MDKWICRKGIVLIHIHGVYMLAADKEARKICPYIMPVNEVGAFIWEKLSQGLSYDEIVSGITNAYDIEDSEDIAHDLDLFLNSLTDRGFLIRHKEPYYSAVPGIILTSICGQHILVCRDDMITLNETGAACWRMLEKGASLTSITRQLAEMYDVDDMDLLEKDIHSLIVQLHKNKLIRRNTDGTD